MSRLKESKQAGRRLLLNYIDAVAAVNPTKVVFTQIISFDPPVQYDLTYQELANIVNRQAWWLAERLHGKARGVTIAYRPSISIGHLLRSY